MTKVATLGPPWPLPFFSCGLHRLVQTERHAQENREAVALGPQARDQLQPGDDVVAHRHRHLDRDAALLALDLHQPGLWGREGLEDQAAHGVDPKGSVRAAVGVAARPWREG